MDIFQTIISHYPKWSKIELITVIIVMIISFIILERYYKKSKITKTQMCFSILFIIYLLHVYGSTVFSRLPSTRKYQLEVFWSWKEIIHPIGRLGTASRYDLLLENILNIVIRDASTAASDFRQIPFRKIIVNKINPTARNYVILIISSSFKKN